MSIPICRSSNRTPISPDTTRCPLLWSPALDNLSPSFTSSFTPYTILAVPRTSLPHSFKHLPSPLLSALTPHYLAPLRIRTTSFLTLPLSPPPSLHLSYYFTGMHSRPSTPLLLPLCPKSLPAPFCTCTSCCNPCCTACQNRSTGLAFFCAAR